MYLAIGLAYLLRLVLHRGDGKVDRQDGEGVYQQVVLVIDRFLKLLFRAILLAEETRALCHRLLIDTGSCRHHPGRVPLYLHARSTHYQLAGLYIAQVVVALSGIVPLLQLTIEEAQEGRILEEFKLAFQHLLTGQDFERAQAILIEIIGINLIDTQGCIAIASPTATEIELSEDAPDTIAARELQSECIILAIRGVGETNLTEQGRKECSWRTQTIDTKGIVRAILIRPLMVVNQARWQGIELEVAHTIRTNHHRCILLVESIDNLLERLGR